MGRLSIRQCHGPILACRCSMMVHLFILVLACSSPPIPERRVPPNTLILRESLQGPGSERTGNWWGRFDQEGCWWQAHNTWMYVTDAELIDNPAHPAHWKPAQLEYYLGNFWLDCTYSNWRG